MTTLAIRSLFIIGIVLLFIVALQYSDKPVKDNTRILELEAEKKLLKASKDEALQNYAVVAKQRDSVLKALENKPQQDKLVIHKKHEIIRNDIVLLTDSASVQLLSDNFRRKRATRNN